MAEGKFAHIPSLIGTTTNELVEVIPSTDDIDSNAAVLELAELNFPYVSLATLQQLVSYYPESDYTNIGPPLSGSEWSRLVAVENDLQMFCPSYAQAVEVSAVTPVWKCKFTQQSNRVLYLTSLSFYSSLECCAPVCACSSLGWRFVPRGTSDLRI
jgi:hypothetical protein